MADKQKPDRDSSAADQDQIAKLQAEIARLEKEYEQSERGAIFDRGRKDHLYQQLKKKRKELAILTGEE